MKILVVDNEPNWCNLCLNLGYYLIKQPEPGKLSETNFDLYIVSDNYSIELFKELRMSNKRFVIATAHPDTHRAIEAYRLGAVDYMVKDFRPEVVKREIDNLKIS